MFNFFSIILVAIGLSMDTFSLSLSYGMFDLKKNTIIRISIIVGLFHFLMPLIGNYLGELIVNVLPISEKMIIGIILLTISVDIFISIFKNVDIKPIKNNIEIIIFAFTVSIDSFSTGIGIDVFNYPKVFISFIFMIISLLFTYFGLSMGKKLHDKIGKKAEIIGIFLLFSLSIMYLFS